MIIAINLKRLFLTLKIKMYMKKLISLALFATLVAVFSTFNLSAQDNTNPNAPDIVFESTTIDYGTIEQNADGNREFKFTNKGKEPLIITTCKGSCGCTVPTCPQEPIMPGQKGVIKVKYDTNRVGAFTKTVTVTSNSKTPTVYLTIKGHVNAAPAVPAQPATPQN